MGERDVKRQQFFYASSAEWERYTQAAKEARINRSEWLREAAVEKIERETGQVIA